MVRLKNPYASDPRYNCFGCSPDNHAGLKMEFQEDGEEIISHWDPDHRFEGFHDVLHGGIQATLMDEIASWVVFVKLGTAGVTYRLNTRYRKPVRLSDGPVSIRAKLLCQARSIASIEVKLKDGKGRECTEGLVEYYLLHPEKAAKEMHYPGRQAFY